jgi:hypothetical protein
MREDLRMNKRGILTVLILILTLVPVSGQEKTKLYKTHNETLLFQSTGPIYKDHIDTDSGTPKYASKGNIFAQVVVYYYNSKADQSGTAKPITIKPDNVLLLNEKIDGQERKIYSGLQATQLMKRSNKPFIEAITLKPGEEKMLTMCFHIPKNAKIVGIMYKLEKKNPLILDFRED